MRFVLFLIACSVFSLSAHPADRVAMRQVEDLLIELRLDAAQSLVDNFQNAAYQAFFQNNIHLYRALSSLDPHKSDLYRSHWDQEFSLVEDLPENDSLREVMLADLSAKRAIVEFIQHNYFSSVKYVRAARKYLDISYSKYGRMVEQLKLEGLFEVMLGSLPEQYHWIAHPLGLSGDVTTGIRYLRLSASTCRLLNAESYLLLALVEKNILDKPAQTLHRLSNYQQRRPGKSILIDFFLASCHQRLKQNEESLEILGSRTDYPESAVSPFPFWDYLAGKAWYFKGDMSQARASFSRFLDSYTGSLFRTDATFRIGMSCLLSGHAANARPWFARIVAADAADQFDEDEYAAAMSARFLAQAPGPVLLQLFRARNAYDGGYFGKATSILEETRDRFALRPAELVEWHYRMGRILHDEQNLEGAARQYQQALRYDADEYSSWLQAYSCFYLADISLESGNKMAAREWIDMALDMDDYYYQSGLENRCKSLLSALERPQEEASSSRR